MNQAFCSVDWVKVTQVFQALLTPVIGIATVVIGVIATRIQRQQALTNRLQHRLALFDRRIKIFDATQDFILLVVREARIETMEPLFKLTQDTKERHLLFGGEIGQYIDELWVKGKRLHSAWLAAGPEHVIKPDDIPADIEINQWFSEQVEGFVAQTKFLKYLDFREP
jgi:hypothetical protein